VTPGINGFSAPVFDHTGRMVAAITSLGIIGSFNLDWDSPMALRTREAAAKLSRRLGHGSVEAIAGDEPSPAATASPETAVDVAAS
jgi:hypothetical protein